jgi:hypothetical protein
MLATNLAQRRFERLQAFFQNRPANVPLHQLYQPWGKREEELLPHQRVIIEL